MSISLARLRVLREIAERGTFTAAARALECTQSAVSRQVAALEQAAGVQLVDRQPGRVRLTAAGHVLLRHGQVALDAVDAAERELRGLTAERGRVRFGAFPAAGVVIVPRALAALRRQWPGTEVVTREGTTPALVRALRAGSIDLAIVSSRPPHRSPDTEDPPLLVEPLMETRLVLAVPEQGRFGQRSQVTAAEIAGEPWIASPAGPDEPLLGVWPGLPGRPQVRHSASDWLAKLRLVASGAGITTIPATLAPALPPGVRLVTVDGVGEEVRRTNLARRPGPVPAPVSALIQVLRDTAGDLAEQESL
jgi:DNA-binding transcriptional LysR family regulator